MATFGRWENTALWEVQNHRMAVYSRVALSHILTGESCMSHAVYLASADCLREVARGLA